MQVVPVQCSEEGDIDLDDLRAKAGEHANDLAAMMITYPSTPGFSKRAFAKFVRWCIQPAAGVSGRRESQRDGRHRAAGRVGRGCMYINLHKTFCIPHGGGGPGMGPIGVAEHLVNFLPGCR